MSKLTKRYIRESVHTPFYYENNEIITNYIKTKYFDTERITSQQIDFSTDGTTITVNISFRSTDDFVEFALDSNQMLRDSNRRRHLYNLRNNIKTETTYIEE